MPFLIDSVGMELNQRGFGVHLIIHPVIQVRRDDEGHLLEVLPHGAEAEGALAESVIHAEVARQTDPGELDAAEGTPRARDRRGARRGRATGGDARSARSTSSPSWAPTRRRSTRDEVAEARAFLAWLEDHNFTFLGYREYELSGEAARADARVGAGHGPRHPAPGRRRASSRGFEQLPPAVRARALEPYLLNLTKANSRSTVHRPSYLDYVGIKRFDANGRVIGERRFLGLYTHTAYHASPQRDPDPAAQGRRGAASARRSRPTATTRRRCVEILESYPRDELFQISVDDLYRIAMGILHLGARQRLRLFVRRDTFDRFVSASCSCRATASTPRTGAASSRSCAEADRRHAASTTRRASPSRCWCGCTSSPTSSPASCRTWTSARSRRCWWPPRAPGATTSRRR